MTINQKIAIFFAILVIYADAQRNQNTRNQFNPIKFAKDAVGGARDMLHAYNDMREANFKNSDKYFHARGNYDAARRGPGGEFSANVISNVRAAYKRLTGASPTDIAADQAANRWGRTGHNPNRFRPPGLPRRF